MTSTVKSVLYQTHRILIGAAIGMFVAFQLLFQLLVVTELAAYQYDDLSFAWAQMFCLVIGAYCGGIAGFTTRTSIRRS